MLWHAVACELGHPGPDRGRATSKYAFVAG